MGEIEIFDPSALLNLTEKKEFFSPSHSSLVLQKYHLMVLFYRLNNIDRYFQD
jgi:hypothetical protein